MLYLSNIANTNAYDIILKNVLELIMIKDNK